MVLHCAAAGDDGWIGADRLNACTALLLVLSRTHCERGVDSEWLAHMTDTRQSRCPVSGCGVWKNVLSKRGGSNRRWYSVDSNRHLLTDLLDQALAAVPCNDHICPNVAFRCWLCCRGSYGCEAVVILPDIQTLLQAHPTPPTARSQPTRPAHCSSQRAASHPAVTTVTAIATVTASTASAASTAPTAPTAAITCPTVPRSPGTVRHYQCRSSCLSTSARHRLW